MKKIKRFMDKVFPVLDGIGARRVGTYAAAGTFYFFLSLPPIIIIVCSVLPFTSITQDIMLSVLSDVVPDSVFALVETIVEKVYDSSAAPLSISIVLTLWSASLTMAALMRGLSVAYDVTRNENYFVFRLKAIFYMVILLVSAILSLIAIVFGRELINIVRSVISVNSEWNDFLHKLGYLRYALLFVFLTLVFTFMYRFTSGTNLKMWKHLPGAAFSSLLWIVFSAVFSIYMSMTSKYSLYGILGTIIVALLWLYYCLYILLIGGYLNNYIYIRKMKKRL